MPTASATTSATTHAHAPAVPARGATAQPAGAVLRRLARWGAAPLALGAIVNLVFLLTADGHVTGSVHMLTAQWAVAHGAHFVAGALLLVGVVGLHAAQATEAGRLGAAAFVVALLGTGFFLATGVFTAFMVPLIAEHAPALVEADGAFFAPPLPFVAVAVVTFSVGWALLAWATARARVFGRGLAALLAAGALLQGLPPRPFGPAPWVLLDAGGALMAVAACGLAWAMWRRAER